MGEALPFFNHLPARCNALPPSLRARHHYGPRRRNREQRQQPQYLPLCGDDGAHGIGVLLWHRRLQLGCHAAAAVL